MNTRHHFLSRIALVVLVAAGTAWMGWEFWRLLWQPEPMGAVDLRLRYVDVHHWFAGVPAYGVHEEVPSVYPPAAFVLLWPFLGWTDFPIARWLWALASTCAIVATMLGFVRGSLAQSKVERWLIAAMAVGTYPVGAALGNGQLAFQVLACTLWAVLLIARHPSGIERCFAVPLIVFSMVKPSSALPFLVLALFLPGGAWPVLTSAVIYLALTFFAITYQPADIGSLFRDMATNSNRLANFTGTLHYANLHVWLAEMGVHRFLLASSLTVLVLFAGWVFLHRKCDLWVLLGVSAIVTRMLTYHRWYDDVLILVPMVALFRLMNVNTSESSKTFPAILFWSGLITMLAPGGLYVLPGFLPRIYTAWETLLWLTYLIFLAQACTRKIPGKVMLRTA